MKTKMKFPSMKLSRRVNTDLFLKSNVKAYDQKCRQSSPGQHGDKRGRLSDYGLQLVEKQKVRILYGVNEKQSRAYYVKASKSKMATGERMLQIFEARLDNVVYRSGFAATRRQARQMVNHKHVMVNGKILNCPSYQLKAQDIVSMVPAAQKHDRVQMSQEIAAQRMEIEWLEVDNKKFEAVVKSLPERSQMPAEINEQLIVEWYSKLA